MNLFNHIRSNYGQKTVSQVRDLERTERKIARNRNHLVFSLRCKELNLTPNSLRIKCPIKTARARDIINKAQKDLLRERIRNINNKINTLNKEKSQLSENLNNELNEDEQRHLSSHIGNCKQAEFDTVKARHVKKLTDLREKQKPRNDEEVDLSGTQLKKWVVNISKHELTKPETSVLAKGLNFAITPSEFPVTDYIVATEQACQKLPNSEATVLRAEIAGAIKGSKPPKSNISKEEQKALKDLKKNNGITILPADKGKATVVMDSVEYDDKIKVLLSDEKTYEKLSTDPTAKYKKDLMTIVTRLRDEAKISQGQYEHLRPSGEVIPRLYATPKIHKPDNALRPIVDYTGSIGYNTSRALADILAPIVGTSIHHVNNSQHLAQDLGEIILEEGKMFVSHDVVSLFTNTPVDKTLEIIEDRLSRDKDLKNRTLLGVKDIMALMSFVLTTTYFQFRGVIYKQKFGVAMGSPVSPIAVNIFMEWLEDQAIHTAPIDCRPRMWKRYVDDIFQVQVYFIFSIIISFTIMYKGIIL